MERTVGRGSVIWVVGLVISSVLVTTMTIVAWQAVAAPPGQFDATYVPISPCRIADTRSAPYRIGNQGTFAANDTRTFVARGEAGECTIPSKAVGLALNVTATDATMPTFVTVWPDGERPTASNLNPAPGQPPVPNFVTTDLASDGSFRVYNFRGEVDLIFDVSGYYISSTLLEIDSRIDEIDSGLPFVLFGKPRLDFRGSVGYYVVTATATVDLDTTGLDSAVCDINFSASASVEVSGHEVVVDDNGIETASNRFPISMTKVFYVPSLGGGDWGDVMNVTFACNATSGQIDVSDEHVIMQFARYLGGSD